MSRNSLTRQVRRAYRQDKLARVCTMPERDFGRAFGMETTEVPTGRNNWYRRADDQPENYYHFRDNGSSVLAVAHLDTVVQPGRRAPHFRGSRNDPYIRSGALDDRLGAYVILDLLPRLGVTCDWLLTTGEESGQSTAEHFKPAKDYDWAIEFDRMGTDVVMYQYEDRASRALVEASGAKMGHGSFSDIAYLEHLGVKAFNWGVGYRGNYHSEAGYAYLNDTFASVARYLRFSEQNAGTPMPHDADDLYADDRYDCYDECYSCGEKRVVDSATGYCTFCGACQDCGATDPNVAEEWGDPDADVCQCYTPRSAQPAARADTGTWTVGMTWEEYMALRPSADDEDNADEINHARCIMAGPDTPASHEHAGQDGLWTGARRSPSIAPPWSEHAPGDKGYVRYWHEAANGLDGIDVVAHTPGAGWQDVCARCAARWPAESGSGDIHLEHDCPGCEIAPDLVALTEQETRS